MRRGDDREMQASSCVASESATMHLTATAGADRVARRRAIVQLARGQGRAVE